MTKRDEKISAMLVQKHQLDQSECKINELDAALNNLQKSQQSNNDSLDQALANLDMMLDNQGLNPQLAKNIDIAQELLVLDNSIAHSHFEPTITHVTLLDHLDFNKNMSWAQYQRSVEQYSLRNHVDLSADPFTTLMSPIQRIQLEKRIKDEFTIQNAQCDAYDYLIAGTCGVIGGLLDVFFVGMPGEGKLTKVADSAVNSAVEKFASACGWQGGKEGGDTTKSAIGYLERNFKVNYDQATTFGNNGTDGAVKNLSPKNHHLKSLGHSPDLIGLFFSILNQFTDTSTFISNGQIITIDTATHELKGDNFIAKVFSGFANWLGHLFSDMAGSSGASERGAGIPIPFYNLLLLLDVGEFGQHRQSFATVATQVFEKGYDLRHGVAMAIPVLITELLTRLMWASKQRFYHKKPWKECIPSGANPELRRMLLVAHGALCLIDAGDAALKSGGEMVQFLLRTNLIGWARFGTLALKEVYAWYNAGHINADAVDEYLDFEMEKLLT
ncbi:hypothetical protein Q7I15_04730 [Aeromonas veronii]|uniref:hypothetical protein n=1 Tax=Aeromonas veronii TaxID=654 RepID=UPI00111A94A1|nr:hypothetical protein [Aeromonas veronii]MBS4704809.1 hypothetical protein [Aeromonas veronii]TNI83194.1 hypothetical protein CF116_00060 [Aeromonas veronii]